MEREDQPSINNEKNVSLMVKIKKLEKCKDAVIDTDLRFEPYEGIRIVTDDDSKNTDHDGEIPQDEDSNDDNYYHSSDLFDKSDKAENTYKELPSLGFPQDTKLIIFWSRILKFLTKSAALVISLPN